MTDTQIEKGDTRPYLIISDTHFGAVHDGTAGEETSLADLENLLDCIESGGVGDIGNIILLGDILDLWRTEFERAFDEAESIGFFKRLDDYAEKNNAKITYLPGNHDHYLKEEDFSHGQIVNFNIIIKEEKESKRFTKKEEDIVFTLNNINPFKNNYKNIELRYPYHIVDIPSIGVTVFDHGHYADGESINARKTIRSLVFLMRLVSEKKIMDSITYFMRGVIEILTGNPKTKQTRTWKEIMKSLETTLCAAYTAIYYSKFDKKTRAYRDYIYNNQAGLVKLILLFILAIIVIGAVLGGGPIGGVIAITVIFSLYKIYTNFITPVLRFLSKMGLEGVNRGSDIKNMLKKIKNEDITLRRDDEERYSYCNLLIDMIKDKCPSKPYINLYVFGHTHVAGYYEDKENNFKICNTGSWVKKTDEKTDHCARSFVLIDPKESKVKVCRMEEGNMVECSINKEKGTCDRKCMK